MANPGKHPDDAPVLSGVLCPVASNFTQDTPEGVFVSFYFFNKILLCLFNIFHIYLCHCYSLMNVIDDGF